MDEIFCLDDMREKVMLRKIIFRISNAIFVASD